MVNDPDVPPNLCFPGKAEVAAMVAEITGKKMEAVENIIAVIRCSKIEGQVREKEHYIGHVSCTGANLAFGGPMACQYACVGLGECAEACPFDAITMKDNLAYIDPYKCKLCRKCVVECPTNAIHELNFPPRKIKTGETAAPKKAMAGRHPDKEKVAVENIDLTEKVKVEKPGAVKETPPIEKVRESAPEEKKSNEEKKEG